MWQRASKRPTERPASQPASQLLPLLLPQALPLFLLLLLTAANSLFASPNQRCSALASHMQHALSTFAFTVAAKTLWRDHLPPPRCSLNLVNLRERERDLTNVYASSAKPACLRRRGSFAARSAGESRATESICGHTKATFVSLLRLCFPSSSSNNNNSGRLLLLLGKFRPEQLI